MPHPKPRPRTSNSRHSTPLRPEKRVYRTVQLHLDEIAKVVAPQRHAVLLLDRAGWHTSHRLDIPGNLTLVLLPAKCPELNPQENIWQFIRDNWLSNRVFKSYDDIVDHCCYAWNKLTDQPWKIMSIAMRDWATGSNQ